MGERTTMESDEKTNENSAADDAAAEWADRRLCSDGNCIGVIGPASRMPRAPVGRPPIRRRHRPPP